MSATSGLTTWVEVSAGALERNLHAVAAHAGVPVCAVVKGNAYGHGLVEAARVLTQAGARWLAVTRVEEATALRRAGVEGHVLVMTPPPAPEALAAAFAADCSVAIDDVSAVARYAAAAHGAGATGRVHLKIDTGMGRLGVRASDALEAAEHITASGSLALEGIFTHFADAAGPSGREQLARFETIRQTLGKHAARALVHASNSAAVLALPGARFDMVRVGTLLYGQNPPGAKAPFPLEETFAWYARVVAVHDLPAGATVGYGHEWKAKHPTRVATLAVGWGDGFTAEPNARGETLGRAATTAAKALASATGVRPEPRAVLFGSRKAKVLGRVGMQAVTVSLDALPGVAVGDVALVPARRLLVDSSIDRVYVP